MKLKRKKIFNKKIKKNKRMRTKLKNIIYHKFVLNDEIENQ